MRLIIKISACGAVAKFAYLNPRYLVIAIGEIKLSGNSDIEILKKKDIYSFYSFTAKKRQVSLSYGSSRYVGL